jgi:hypothetical protein
LTFLTIAATTVSSSSLGSPATAATVATVVVVSRSATPRYCLLDSSLSNAARSLSVPRLRKVFGPSATRVEPFPDPDPDPPAAAESFAAVFNPGTDDFGIVRLLEIGTGICDEEEDPLGNGEAVPPDVRFEDEEADEVVDGVRR